MILTLALIICRLGYVLRTPNILSQVTGYPNYRVSIFSVVSTGFNFLFQLLKEREVFLSRQTETLPATLIRGKCSVTLLSEVETANSYLSRYSNHPNNGHLKTGFI